MIMFYQDLKVNLNRYLMKNIYSKFWLIGGVALLVSCSENYPMYDLKETRLGFKF